VIGYAGTYDLEVSAPGFEFALRTVTVRGLDPEGCGCATVFTERLEVVLVASR
jgi:hypothetical protein